MSTAPKVLIVDDETSILDTLRILLKRDGFEVHTAVGGQQGLDWLDNNRPDFIITDIRMPGVGGIEILNTAREIDATIPVILMTAQASLQSAIQAVNQGAYHYIQKPFANDELLVICRRAAESRQLKQENQALKREIRRRDASAQVVRPIGKSRSFIDVVQLAETVAPTDSTVLISGESGTGKEVVARYIHALSERTSGPFVSINCGALPENLLESELFGHVKGSFTGAVRDKEGLFVAARAGTFFLDEVGEMSAATQVKLLRALQEREVIPVGATEAVPIDVRIIAATNRDLEEEIRRGSFRGDLYYRLNVITLHLPPLRDRADVVVEGPAGVVELLTSLCPAMKRRLAGPGHRRGSTTSTPRRRRCPARRSCARCATPTATTSGWSPTRGPSARRGAARTSRARRPDPGPATGAPSREPA
ncbi:MAG: sigma-54 dependent transcriptional regulator, partial [Gemmatimonadetes bacterium]|nr:sigma-54 dependent transcriptional regulator [Gemmatimonadota bacterium]